MLDNLRFLRWELWLAPGGDIGPSTAAASGASPAGRPVALAQAVPCPPRSSVFGTRCGVFCEDRRELRAVIAGD